MSRNTATAARASKSAPRRYLSGQASQQQIIAAAESVLKRDGYHAFTTRRVAEQCGISVGNLTYYFPTKVTLIEALMDAVFGRYERFAEEIRSRKGVDGNTRVEAIVNWLLRDAVTADTASLFLELWVMAKHHAFGADALTNFYDRGVHAIATTLGEEYRELSEQELLRIGRFLLTLSEGCTAVFGRAGDEDAAHEEVVSMAVSVVESMVGREPRR